MKKKAKKSSVVFEDRASIFDHRSVGFIWEPPPLDDALGPSQGMGPLAVPDNNCNVRLLHETSALLSSKLTHLVFLYEMLEGLHGVEAERKLFWVMVDKWEREGDLTRAERDILYKAKIHDHAAIKTLLSASPHVIKLPFIREYLLELLLKYRTEPKGSLKPIKHLWTQLLPSRDKNRIPYSAADIEGLVQCEKELNKKDPSRRVAEKLKVSTQKIRQVCPVKAGPGRLRKLSN